MKNKFAIALLALLSVGVLVGCGRSREDIERERRQIEMEEQAQRDLQRANKAVGELGKKIGRKVPLYDLGLPAAAEKKADGTPEAARKP